MSRRTPIGAHLMVPLIGLFLFGMSLPAAAKGDRPTKPQHHQPSCEAISGVEQHLGCRDLTIEIASLYLDSICLLSQGEYVQDLPEFVHPEVKRWINRNRYYQPPNNDGPEEFLAGVLREPTCSCDHMQWTVEGNEAVASFDIDCVGYSQPVPTVVRDRFLIEDGLIKEVEVRYVFATPLP